MVVGEPRGSRRKGVVMSTGHHRLGVRAWWRAGAALLLAGMAGSAPGAGASATPYQRLKESLVAMQARGEITEAAVSEVLARTRGLAAPAADKTGRVDAASLETIAADQVTPILQSALVPQAQQQALIDGVNEWLTARARMDAAWGAIKRALSDEAAAGRLQPAAVGGTLAAVAALPPPGADDPSSSVDKLLADAHVDSGAVAELRGLIVEWLAARQLAS